MKSRTVIAWFTGLILLSAAATTINARDLGGTEHKGLLQHLYAYLHRAGGALDFGSYEWTLVNEEAEWAPRAGLQVVELRNRFYLMGGRTARPPSFPPIPGDSDIWGDVWMSDDRGESWNASSRRRSGPLAGARLLPGRDQGRTCTCSAVRTSAGTRMRARDPRTALPLGLGLLQRRVAQPRRGALEADDRERGLGGPRGAQRGGLQGRNLRHGRLLER